MGIPAVKRKKRTAGKQTKLFKNLSGVFAALLLIAAAPSAAAQTLKPAQTVRTITVPQKIPFETTYIDLPDRYVGYEILVSEGVMGEQEIQAQVSYLGEKPVKALSIKSVETAKPINRVIKRGTKVLRSQTADGRPWSVSFTHPLKTGWLSADFYDYRGHNGVDFAAPRGTPVYAAAEGTVTIAGWYGEYGKCVIINHADGSQTLYAHNSALTVSSGQRVKQGQKIAEVGTTGNSTGNHVHFELRVGNRFLDPLVHLEK